MAAAEASFRTEIDSISPGGMSFRGLLISLDVVDGGKPSTTYSGWVPAPMAPTPRIWIWGPPPGIPLLWLICTAATWPARAWSTPVTGRDLMFSVLPPPTDPVTSVLRRGPYRTATVRSRSTHG